MSERFKKIFSKEKNIVIGAIHFPPLPGYPDFPGLDIAYENALKDLRALELGGVDAVIVENNYDVPHKTFVDAGVAEALEYLSAKIKSATKLPVGISVLWNDYKTALTIAKKVDLKFIRVPVFIDTVETSYGIMDPKADGVISFRKNIEAEDVLLLTDIHVKHSKVISPYTINESARMAIDKGSDALIITGRWTGEAPDFKEIEEVRKSIGDFPILCGSGVDSTNIVNLFNIANGAIVSTSLKEDLGKKDEVNVKAYECRIDPLKVKNLVQKLS